MFVRISVRLDMKISPEINFIVKCIIDDEIILERRIYVFQILPYECLVILTSETCTVSKMGLMLIYGIRFLLFMQSKECHTGDS